MLLPNAVQLDTAEPATRSMPICKNHITLAYWITDISTFDYCLADEYSFLERIDWIPVDHFLKTGHKFRMYTHIRGDHYQEKQFAKSLSGDWTVKKNTKTIGFHDLQHERVVHLFQNRLVVVDFRKGCLGVPLTKYICVSFGLLIWQGITYKKCIGESWMANIVPDGCNI